MMQDDPRVDDLMRPVNAAIRRHVKDGDAVTEIYNRAYEAVMTSMDVKAGKTYCAYCGAEYPLDDDAATLVSEHIKTCEKHPMRAVEARAEAAEATLDKVYVLTTRELAEPCGKETDTLIKIASAIEAIRYPQQTPEDDGFRKCCPSCGVKYTVDITITQLRERAEAAEARAAELQAALDFIRESEEGGEK